MKDCDHIWNESEYLPPNAILEYWCRGDARCRNAKEQAIYSACERGIVQHIRADGKTFDDPVRELAARNNLLIHRQSFNAWADVVDKSAKRYDEAVSTRERDTLYKIIIGMATAKYGYKPDAQRNEAITDIVRDLEKTGIPVSDDTVRKHLKAAAGSMPLQPA